MEKPFYEFESYLSEHQSELAFDAKQIIDSYDFPMIFQNEDIARGIATIAKSMFIPYLRAYHNWMNSES